MVVLVALVAGVRPQSDARAAGSLPPPVPDNHVPAPWSNTPTIAAPACAPDEDPAVGCGLRIVGSNDILGRGDNFNMAKIGSCAYVTSSGKAEPAVGTPPAAASATDGVAVLNVRDPAHPQLVKILHTQAAIDSGETISAVDAGKRKVLAVGAYGGRETVAPLDSAYGPALDIYDVSGDCTNPRLMSSVYWPDNAHNLTVNPSATRVYGTRYAAEPKATAATALDAGGAGRAVAASPVPLTQVMVMDIHDLAQPHLAAQLPLILPDGSPTECHKVEFNRAETRMYCAGNKVSDTAAPDGREPPYSVWPDAGPSIWDVSEISHGRPNPVAHFVGESAVKGQGGHHAVPMTINGRRYLIAANELNFTCDMAAYPRIWDITDETKPKVVSELHLPAADNCNGNHYNNVDDTQHTTMALVSWIGAGFRVFDLRDPVHPRAVAYFKPGSDCYSIAYLDKPSGYIWFACQGGFYVADLSSSARASMGLPSRPASAPIGVSSNAWALRVPATSATATSANEQAVVRYACWLPAAAAHLQSG